MGTFRGMPLERDFSDPRFPARLAFGELHRHHPATKICSLESLMLGQPSNNVYYFLV